MKKPVVLIILHILLSFSAKAEEGMWLLPSLKENLSEMKNLGLQLNLNEIYHPDSISIKDAIVIFGPGCTGEVISNQGLVLTNHHCGYSYIQEQSTLENNYLKDGFWAKNKEQELPISGLQVTFIEKIEDVTEFVIQKQKEDTL